MVKNLSCVSCAAWNDFPINSLVSSSCMYATTTDSAVVQVWENHRTLFVAHCSKAEDHFEEEAMLKRVFLLYYVSCYRVSP